MLDLLNVNVGSGGFGKRYAATATAANSRGVRVVNLPKAGDTDETKYAKKIVRLFDVAAFNYYAVAAALWDVAPDGVKRHLYGLADALFDVAADKHARGLDYTEFEMEVGTNAAIMRAMLTTGDTEDIDETLDYLEGLRSDQ